MVHQDGRSGSEREELAVPHRDRVEHGTDREVPNVVIVIAKVEQATRCACGRDLGGCY